MKVVNFQVFKKIFKYFSTIIDDLFLIAGIVFVSLGVFKINIPFGYITLGLCFMAFAYLIAKRR